MPFFQAHIKALAQAPPAGATVAAAFAAFYFAAAPVGHLVAGQVAEWSKPRIVFVPQPRETPPAAPLPIASATPRPEPAPQPKRKDRVPEAPKPAPTVGMDLPPPIAPLPPDIAASSPIIGILPSRPESPRAHIISRPWHPRHFAAEELPTRGFGHDDLGRAWSREFITRERGGFSAFEGGDFGHRMSGQFGGFPFARRPMPGGFIQPRMPFGGGFGHFGHFHLF